MTLWGWCCAILYGDRPNVTQVMFWLRGVSQNYIQYVLSLWLEVPKRHAMEYRYVCMYACMNVWMYACMNASMHECRDVWMYGWMYECTSSTSQGGGGSFRIGTYRRGWLLWITDGRGNLLIDPKVVGFVFVGVAAMVAVVTSPTAGGCSVWCSAAVVVM